jgi:hypothetical protein
MSNTIEEPQNGSGAWRSHPGAYLAIFATISKRSPGKTQKVMKKVMKKEPAPNESQTVAGCSFQREKLS